MKDGERAMNLMQYAAAADAFRKAVLIKPNDKKAKDSLDLATLLALTAPRGRR
jgi:hypothetical protein